MKLDRHECLQVIKQELYTPVVGDIMDQMGLYHQFLPQAVRPLRPDMKLAGYAMTVLMIDVYGEQKKPFGYLTEALDDLKQDEVYLATGSRENIKITTPLDLELAALILRRRAEA